MYKKIKSFLIIFIFLTFVGVLVYPVKAEVSNKVKKTNVIANYRNSDWSSWLKTYNEMGGLSSSGYSGDISEWVWYYQMNGKLGKAQKGKDWYHHNYGSSISSGEGACGICSLASVMTSFSGNDKDFWPNKIAKSGKKGVAYKWGLLQSDGYNNIQNNKAKFEKGINDHTSVLHVKAQCYHASLSIEKVRKTIRKGGVITVLVHNANVGGVSYAGHHINIIGCKGNKVILADPGSYRTTHKSLKDPGTGKQGAATTVSSSFLNDVDDYCVFLPSGRVLKGGLKGKMLDVINVIYAQRGKPYVYGASGPNSFDCSGLIMYSFNKGAGFTFGRDSRSQYTALKSKVGKGGKKYTVSRVAKNQCKKGDLIYYNYGGGISHVAMYWDPGKIFHASTEGVPIGTAKYTTKGVVAVFRITIK